MQHRLLNQLMQWPKRSSGHTVVFRKEAEMLPWGEGMEPLGWCRAQPTPRGTCGDLGCFHRSPEFARFSLCRWASSSSAALQHSFWALACECLDIYSAQKTTR